MPSLVAFSCHHSTCWVSYILYPFDATVKVDFLGRLYIIHWHFWCCGMMNSLPSVCQAFVTPATLQTPWVAGRAAKSLTCKLLQSGQLTSWGQQYPMSFSVSYIPMQDSSQSKTPSLKSPSCFTGHLYERSKYISPPIETRMICCPEGLRKWIHPCCPMDSGHKETLPITASSNQKFIKHQKS